MSEEMTPERLQAALAVMGECDEAPRFISTPTADIADGEIVALFPAGHSYVEGRGPDPDKPISIAKLETAPEVFLVDHPRIKVWQGTWERMLELHPEIPQFDHVLSDPPFTGHVQDNVRSVLGSSAKAVEAVRQGRADIKIKNYELNFAPLAGYEHVPTLLRRTKGWLILFCAQEQYDAYRLAAGGWWSAKTNPERGCYIRSGTWRKKQAAPATHGRWPGHSCEGIAIMHARAKGLGPKRVLLANPEAVPTKWNGGGKHAYWVVDPDGKFVCEHNDDITVLCGEPGQADISQCNHCGDIRIEDGRWLGVLSPAAIEELHNFGFYDFGREKAQKRHPAQKPKALCEAIAKQFVQPGDIVADLWAGGGNMGFAALDAGAGCIYLAERDPPWAQHNAARAEEWIKAHEFI